MKRKFLVVFMAIVTAFCMAFGMVGCGEKNPDETGNNPPISDPSDGEQGGTQKPDEGEQGGTQKPDEGEQGGTQKPNEGEQGGTQKPDEETPTHAHAFDVDNLCTICSENLNYSEGLEYSFLDLSQLDPRQYTWMFPEGYPYKITEGVYFVSGIGTASGDIVLPCGYQGKPVIGIHVEDVEILRSVFVSDASVSVWIEDCPSLENVVFADNSWQYAIGSDFGSIRNCPLKYIKLSKRLTEFYSSSIDCSVLEKIEMDPDNPVYYCEGNCLIERKSNTLVMGCKTSKIPDDGSVTSIGYGAFEGCSGLTSITIPDSVTSIGMDAFSGCNGLNSVTIGSGVNSIGSSVFSGCSGLTSVTIGSGVTTIGNSAFEGCIGLTSITIPDSVISIGREAFNGCSGLTSIKIPDSVTEIGEDAFFDTAHYNNNNNWTDDVLYIGNHLIKAKNTISGSYSIRGGTKTIADNAFSGCSGLTAVTIGSGVTSIKYKMFSGCSGLTSVIIPDSVTEIEAYAFSGCSGLTSITIPDSMVSIGAGAFSYCSGLTSITIPDSVTEIGVQAFEGCSGLASVTIGNGITWIEMGLFGGCSKLKEVYFKNSNGWKVSEYSDMRNAKDVVGLDNPATAAKYLSDPRYSYYWKREG